jgi:molybdopterin converting factor small subunit
MKIVFMGSIKEGMDERTIYIPSESVTSVEQVLRKVALKYPVFKDFLINVENGDVSNYMLMTVNGKVVDLKTTICQEDVLKIFLPLVGG